MSISFLAVVTTVFALGTGNMNTAGLCSSLDRNSCVKSTSCRWIREYERSDGRKVAAYCRTLPDTKVGKQVPPASSRKG